MIREVVAYEAVCDCGNPGCRERLFLGERRETIIIKLNMNGWKVMGEQIVSLGCEFPKAKKRKAKP